MPLNNVPISGQSLNASRPLINSNFSTIDTAFSVNHVPYNDPSGNQGKHNYVTMPIQPTNPPVGAFSGTDRGFYSFINPVTTRPELYAHVSRISSTAEVPFSASILSVTNPAVDSNGWSYLPSGILIKWGTAASTLVDPNGITTINFPAAGNIPVFTTVFSIMISPYAQTSGPSVTPDIFVTLLNYGHDFMRVRGSSRTSPTPLAVNFNYLAIGV